MAGSPTGVNEQVMVEKKQNPFALPVIIASGRVGEDRKPVGFVLRGEISLETFPVLYLFS